MNNVRVWRVLLIFLLIVLGGLYLLKKQDGKAINPFLPAAVRMQPQIELQFNEVVMQGRQKGTKRWNIWAKQVQISQDQQYVYFENHPKGSFYNLKDWSASASTTTTAVPAMVPPTINAPVPGYPAVPSPSPSYYTGKVRTADWTANRAEYDTYAESLKLQGNAVLVTDEKDELKTELLEYRTRQNSVAIPKKMTFLSHDKSRIAADQASADIKLEKLDLKGKVSVFSPMKNSTSSVFIKAEKIDCDRPAKVFLAREKVDILQEDTRIKTEAARYDQGAKITAIDVPVEVIQKPKNEPQTVLTGESLTMYHQEKRVLVEGDVKLVREGEKKEEKASKGGRNAKLRKALKKERTFITGDRMEYWTDRKDARFDGHVTAYQKEKRAEGDQSVVDNARGTIVMHGHVRLTQIKGDWLVRAKLVKKNPGDKEQKETLSSKATLTCDDLEIDQRSNDATATGSVVLRQKSKVATSDQAIFSDKNQTITLLENVRIKKEDTGEWMTAQKAVFHQDSEKFEAFGSPQKQAEAEFGLDKKEKKSRIVADEIRDDKKANQAYAFGHVKIKQEDVEIKAERARYDMLKKISTIDVPVEVLQKPKNQPQTTLTGKSLVMMHAQKKVLVNGDVKLVRQGNPNAQAPDPSRKEKLKTAFKKEDTVITGDRMEYWTDKKDAKFIGKVIVLQKEKKAEGDECFLDNARGTITLTGKVKLTQIKGDWLVREGLVDDSTPDKDRDEAIENQSTVDCDKLVIDQKTNNALATGKLVTIKQKNKTAISKKTFYEDKAQTTTLTEDVYVKREDTGEWMKAQRAVFHHDKDRFEAYGTPKARVETEFGLDDGKKQ